MCVLLSDETAKPNTGLPIPFDARHSSPRLSSGTSTHNSISYRFLETTQPVLLKNGLCGEMFTFPGSTPIYAASKCRVDWRFF